MADINVELVQKQFASFCCKIIKCAAVDFYRSEQRSQLHSVPTIPISDLKATDEIALAELYENEDKHSLYITALERVVYIANDALTVALKRLPVIQRDILLMYYFLEMSDENIGKYFDLYRQQVTYRRKKAIYSLSTLMSTGGQYEK